MKLLQWVHSKLVPANTAQPLDGPNPFTWCSEIYPYAVPEGHWLGITAATLGSKFTDGGQYQRASFFVVTNVLSLPDNVGQLSFNPPLVVPAGVTLAASLINNEAEQQWMTCSLHGILVPANGADWRDAFTFLYPGGSA